MISACLSTIFITFIAVLIVFIIGVANKNNGVADIFWGFGFCIIAFYSFWHFAEMHPNQIMITACVLIWGLRLTIYLFNRNRNKPEDFRYQNFRKMYGKYQALGSFLQVYMLQFFLMVLVAIPIVYTNFEIKSENFPIALIGFLLFHFGFVYESTADYQLKKFKADPANKGKILMQGLWKYSRHPNYFGEAVLWWGIFLIAVASGHFWPAILSPVLITYLLTRVSGVPMLEEKYKDHPEYLDYIRNTNTFIPGLPK